MDEDNHKETIVEEFYRRLPSRWPVLLASLIIALAAAFLIVYGVRTVYRDHHKPAVKTPPISVKSSRPSISSKNNSSQTSGNQPATTSLPNSGPGQVVGLFIGASLAATGLHFVISLRRRSKIN